MWIFWSPSRHFILQNFSTSETSHPSRLFILQDFFLILQGFSSFKTEDAFRLITLLYFASHNNYVFSAERIFPPSQVPAILCFDTSSSLSVLSILPTDMRVMTHVAYFRSRVPQVYQHQYYTGISRSNENEEAQ